MRQNLLNLPRRAGLSGRAPVGVFLRSTSTKAESGATGPTSSGNGSNGDGNGNGNALDSRWFSDFRHRVNKLGNAQLPADLAEKRSGLVRYVQDHWVDLLAGREGYITKKEWRGLDSHQVAWGEMDSMGNSTFPAIYMGHINNTMYNRYAETSRVNWITYHGREVGLEEKMKWENMVTPRAVGLIMRSIMTQYKFPVTFPDRVIVLHRLSEKPTSTSDHIKLEALILSETYQRVAAKCSEDNVIYDYRAGKRTQLDADLAKTFGHTYDIQEETRRFYDAEIARLFKVCEELEGNIQS